LGKKTILEDFSVERLENPILSDFKKCNTKGKSWSFSLCGRWFRTINGNKKFL